MKILYITNVNISEKSGVASKINGQIDAMCNKGLDASIIYATGNTINYRYLDKTKVLDEYKTLPIIGFFGVLKVLYRNALHIISKEKYGAVYIRYSISTSSLIKFLKILSKCKVKIFLEIASFPYDKEYKNKNILKKIGLVIDKYYRKRLKYYVNFCFTPSKVQEDIYGIKTITFDNGVNIKDIKKRVYLGCEKGVFRILAVANVSPWHGYDRVVRGVYDYYNSGGKQKIIFNIVGDGMGIKDLEALVEELNLRDNVVFHGKKFGEDLQKVYNSSEIGVGAIGMYRLGTDNVSSLKSREYCLQSLPFITTVGDDDFIKDFNYVFYVNNESTPIDIRAVLKFFDEVRNSDYIDDMYNYAKKNLSWESKFVVVIDTIKLC